MTLFNSKDIGVLAGILIAVVGLSILIVWLNTRLAGSTDCGSFDISAYRLGNVPARCADYLVN